METNGNSSPSFFNLWLLPSQWKLQIKTVSSKDVITCRRGRCTPSTFMVSALARIFRGSDVFVTPSISLLISAKTWLRKMFLMYTVRNSRRGHCLAGPSPRACSISWMNLKDKQSTTTVKCIRKIATEIWPNTRGYLWLLLLPWRDVGKLPEFSTRAGHSVFHLHISFF